MYMHRNEYIVCTVTLDLFHLDNVLMSAHSDLPQTLNILLNVLIDTIIYLVSFWLMNTSPPLFYTITMLQRISSYTDCGIHVCEYPMGKFLLMEFLHQKAVFLTLKDLVKSLTLQKYPTN